MAPDYDSRASDGGISRDTFAEFRRRCDERHERIEDSLKAIQAGIDAMILRLDSREERMEKLERTMWWQRGILVLCAALVSLHPVAQAVPLLKHVIGGHP